ncbi:hypothetical protein IWZ01DRAFT_156838 [Phyllosticta capitalensis]
MQDSSWRFDFVLTAFGCGVSSGAAVQSKTFPRLVLLQHRKSADCRHHQGILVGNREHVPRPSSTSSSLPLWRSPNHPCADELLLQTSAPSSTTGPSFAVPPTRPDASVVQARNKGALRPATCPANPCRLVRRFAASMPLCSLGVAASTIE